MIANVHSHSKFFLVLLITLLLMICSCSKKENGLLLLAGDINDSTNSLLTKNVHIEATIGNLYDCKVASNKGYICMLLDGSDSSRYELSFIESSKFDRKLIDGWHNDHKLLKISGIVELRENSKGQKIPSLVISEMEPIEKHSDEHFTLLNAYFAKKKNGNQKESSAQVQNGTSSVTISQNWEDQDLSQAGLQKNINGIKLNKDLVAKVNGKILVWYKLHNNDRWAAFLQEIDCAANAFNEKEMYMINQYGADDLASHSKPQAEELQYMSGSITRPSPLAFISNVVCNTPNLYTKMDKIDAYKVQLDKATVKFDRQVENEKTAQLQKEKTKEEAEKRAWPLRNLVACSFPYSKDTALSMVTTLANLAINNPQGFGYAMTSGAYREHCQVVNGSPNPAFFPNAREIQHKQDEDSYQAADGKFVIGHKNDVSYFVSVNNEGVALAFYGRGCFDSGYWKPCVK